MCRGSVVCVSEMLMGPVTSIFVRRVGRDLIVLICVSCEEGGEAADLSVRTLSTVHGACMTYGMVHVIHVKAGRVGRMRRCAFTAQGGGCAARAQERCGHRQ